MLECPRDMAAAFTNLDGQFGKRPQGVTPPAVSKIPSLRFSLVSRSVKQIDFDFSPCFVKIDNKRSDSEGGDQGL